LFKKLCTFPVDVIINILSVISTRNPPFVLAKNVNYKGNKSGIKHSLIFFLSSISKYYRSNITMIMLTIVITLVCQGVERNPGPQRRIEIITYNCNGLGDRKKLRRLPMKADKKVQNGAIIFLQEMHIVNTDYINLIWKNKFVSNGHTTSSAGVIILFNNKYDLKLSIDGKDGRQIVRVIQNNDTTIIAANAYFPNDHKEGTKFAESFYLKILEAQNEYPESLTICASYFNTCILNEDSMGRNKTRN
jgi:hypothetical protein